jgi:putative DNA primase/helicase
MMRIDYDKLSKDLLAMADRLVSEWYPNGKRSGREWVVGDVLGNPGGSLSINTETGVWKDFSTEEAGGNLITLFAKREGIANSEAARRLADTYMLNGVSHPTKSNRALLAPPVFPPADAPPPISAHNGLWQYTDKDGQLMFYISRHDEEDFDDSGKRKKRFCQWSWNGQEKRWQRKSWPAPRPLYGLSMLYHDTERKVLIVEGEKCADAARRILGDRAVVITWPGGASAVNNVDWRPLTNRDVTILPDADKNGAGQKAATAIGQILHAQGCRVKIVDVSEVERDKWDVADAEADGWDAKRLGEWARDKARSYTDTISPAKHEALSIVVENPADDTMCPNAIHQHLWRELGLIVNGMGKPIANATNVAITLKAMGKYADDIWWDRFYQQLMILDEGKPRPVDDHDTIRLMTMFQYKVGIANINKGTIWDGMIALGCGRKRNCVEERMRSVSWDGEKRIDFFFEKSFGARPSEYTRAASKNFLISLVARVCKPGSKVDNMVILEGLQGAGKSTLLRLLCKDLFAEIIQKQFDPRELLLSAQGLMLVEMGELHVFKTADINLLKSFITNESDMVRFPYDRVGRRLARQFVLVGTTNSDEYLADSTGNRRFWPIKCETLCAEYVAENREQLFAEALARYDNGESWWEMPAEETQEIVETRRYQDGWEDLIAENMCKLPGSVTVAEILRNVFKREDGKFDGRDMARVVRCLRALGWTRTTKRIDGRLTRLWVQPRAQRDMF